MMLGIEELAHMRSTTSNRASMHSMWHRLCWGLTLSSA